MLPASGSVQLRFLFCVPGLQPTVCVAQLGAKTVAGQLVELLLQLRDKLGVVASDVSVSASAGVSAAGSLASADTLTCVNAAAAQQWQLEYQLPDGCEWFPIAATVPLVNMPLLHGSCLRLSRKRLQHTESASIRKSVHTADMQQHVSVSGNMFTVPVAVAAHRALGAAYAQRLQQAAAADPSDDYAQLRSQVAAENHPSVKEQMPLFGLLLPIISALLMFLLLQSPYVLLLAILSPLLLIASWADRRRGVGSRVRNKARTNWQTTYTQLAVKAARQRLEPSAQPGDWVLCVLNAQLQNQMSVTAEQLQATIWSGVWGNLVTQTIPLRHGHKYEIVGDAASVQAAIRAVLGELLLRLDPTRLQLSCTNLLGVIGASWFLTPHSVVTPTAADAIPVHITFSGLQSSTRGKTQTADAQYLSVQHPSVQVASVQIGQPIGFPQKTELVHNTVLQAADVTQLSSTGFRRLCQMVAPYTDAGSSNQQKDTSWLAVNGLALHKLVAQLHENWQKTAVTKSVLGADFVLDIDQDGPHMLIGGTTGSGKSELLQSMLLSLAAQNCPRRLRFLLIDYKGGASFGQLDQLPHTDALVTDLDAGAVVRVLAQLDAEIKLREAALKNAAVANFLAYNQLQKTLQMPRLLIVIDEFAALLAEHPDGEKNFADIAQRGRSLGLHLILATQRPAGTISEKLRANIETKIALRVANANESKDIIGITGAESIAKTQHGTCYVASGAKPPVKKQVSGINISVTASAQLQLAAYCDQQTVQLTADRAEANAATGEDLTVGKQVVQALAALAKQQQESAAASWHRCYSPELSQLIAADGSCVAVAENLETFQKTLLQTGDFARAVGIVGAAGTGKTTALYAFAQAAKTRTVLWNQHLFRDRFALLRHCWHLLTELNMSESSDADTQIRCVVLIDDVAQLSDYYNRSDTAVITAVSAVLKHSCAQVIIAARNRSEIAAGVRTELVDWVYLSSDDSTGYSRMSRVGGALMMLERQAPGRAVMPSRQAQIQFVYTAAAPPTAFEKFSRFGGNTVAAEQHPSWGTNLLTGKPVQISARGVILLRCKSKKQLRAAVANLLAHLPVTGIEMVAAEAGADNEDLVYPTISTQQLTQAAAAITANASTEPVKKIQQTAATNALVILDTLGLTDAACAAVLQIAQSAKSINTVVVLGQVRGEQSPWQLQTLLQTAEQVIELAPASQDVLHPQISASVDRFAKYSPSQALLLQDDQVLSVQVCAGTESAGRDDRNQ